MIKSNVRDLLTEDEKRCYDYILKLNKEQHVNLEEAILKSIKLLPSEKYRNFMKQILHSLYIATYRFAKKYPPNNIRKYKKFREFIEEAEKEIKGNTSSKKVDKIVNELLKLK
jgi:hypothetical protein